MKIKRLFTALLAVCMIICMLPAGTIQVSAAETYPVLEPDAKTTITLAAGASTYLEIRPEVSETFQFTFSYSAWSFDEPSFYYWLYDASFNPLYNEDLMFIRKFSYKLEAGNTYYLQIQSELSKTDSLDVTVSPVHSYTMEVTTEATCTTPGIRVYTCSGCGDSYSEEYILDHEYEMGVCTTCGAAKLLELDTPLTMSAPGAYVEDWAIFRPEATEYYEFHSNSAYDTYGCLYDSNNQFIASDDDSYGYLQFSITALLEAGQTYYLSVMSYDEDESALYFDVIATAHHSYTRTTTQEATCTTPGTYLYACDYCGDSYTEAYSIPHHYVDGYCEYCNAALSVGGSWGSNAFWTLNTDGTLTISGQGALTDFHFDSDAPWASYSDYIKHIVIEEGITSFGYYTFSRYYSPNIVSVSLPETLTEIGSHAFFGCASLSQINFPSSLRSIGPCAFQGCDSLTEVVLPEGFTAIYYGGFNGCSGLKTITLPSTLTTLDDMSLAFCDSLERVIFLGNGFDMSQSDDPELVCTPFYGTTTTCLYPAGNATWTGDVMKQYGGTLTWLPYSDAEIIASGWSGSSTWTLSADGLMTFSGEGAMKNYTTKDAMPWYSYADRITTVLIEDGITAIGSYAFYGMPVQKILIPETVTAIGDYAFKGCPALDGVVLPAGLTRLGESAFYGCTSLTAIEIPAALWTIQPYTFKNCSALESVTFHEGNLQKISDGAFYGTAVKEVAFPDCLDILDVYSFKNCAALETINLGTGLTEIREAVFYGTAVTEMTIPEGITTIGPYAFKNCVKLETISLPESLTSVGEASFYACTALKGVDFPDKVTTIGNYAFRKCAAMESVSFGSELTTIGECSFYGCTGLTELVIPDKVTTIKPYAFKTCTGLTSVTLGSKVATIGEGAFNTCTGLKTIVFPASLTAIGDYCFSGSYNLWKLTFAGDAPTIGTGAFKSMVATAYYPSGNSTWTASVRQNYGGTITWKAN